MYENDNYSSLDKSYCLDILAYCIVYCILVATKFANQNSTISIFIKDNIL